MCGRYYVDFHMEKEIRRVLGRPDLELFLQEGDVRPGDSALVLKGAREKICPEKMKWGFLQQAGKGIVINGRAETAAEKGMFRESINFCRCVIPASGFYEWNRLKEKAMFARTDGGALYLAGVYRRFEEEERFVILTTKANSSVKPVHDRMPVILEERELEPWFLDGNSWRKFLEKIPMAVRRYQEYEQQSFLF